MSSTLESWTGNLQSYCIHSSPGEWCLVSVKHTYHVHISSCWVLHRPWKAEVSEEDECRKGWELIWPFQIRVYFPVHRPPISRWTTYFSIIYPKCPYLPPGSYLHWSSYFSCGCLYTSLTKTLALQFLRTWLLMVFACGEGSSRNFGPLYLERVCISEQFGIS